VEEVVVAVVGLAAAGDAADGAEACTTKRSLALPGSLETGAGWFAAGGAVAAGAGLVCACVRDNALSNTAVVKLKCLKVVTIIISGMR
jgi:hypothetical protein